jgi:hypothetical protein
VADLQVGAFHEAERSARHKLNGVQLQPWTPFSFSPAVFVGRGFSRDITTR